MYKSFFCLIIFPFLLLSCSEEKERPAQTANQPVSRSEARATRVQEQDTEPDYAKMNPEISNAVLSLDSIYDRTPYYTKVNGQYLFYVCKGIWEIPSDTFKNAKATFGLADETGKVWLPPVYSKLYNPDLTAKGYIEIEKNGKRGLFNYTSGAVIMPEFDVIFPSEHASFSAIAKRGESYFGVQGDRVVPYEGEIPTYNAFAEKWKLDVMASGIIYWNESYQEFYEGDPEEGIGTVFTPSYLLQLNFLPEMVRWIVTNDKKEGFGVVETKGSIVESHAFSDKLYALITSFYEEGIDGRGWEISRNHIVTVDDKNNVINKTIVLQAPDRGMVYYCGENMTGYRYMANNLLEVRDLKTPMDYPPYDNMTVFDYYKIQDNGIIQKQNSTRVFEFTKYVEIDESYFNGCFSKRLDDVMTVEGEEGNMWQYDHLTLEDLDLMRNEIYAEYGMKFKTDKWKQYFSKHTWYVPKYDNVDHLLTPLDKHNLVVILAEQAKMKGKENIFTQKKLIMYAPAG